MNEKANIIFDRLGGVLLVVALLLVLYCMNIVTRTQETMKQIDSYVANVGKDLNNCMDSNEMLHKDITILEVRLQKTFTCNME